MFLSFSSVLILTLRPALCIIGTTIKVRQNDPPDRGGRVCLRARPTVYKNYFSEERNQHEKALAIILSVMMLMSTLVACGSKTDDSGDANNDAAASYPTKM